MLAGGFEEALIRPTRPNVAPPSNKSTDRETLLRAVSDDIG